MGLMESLKSYWNSVPASKVYPQIKNHVSNVYTTLAPSTKPEDRKQAAGKWAESVIDGIAGMGPSDIGVGGLMGYTKNGIPHNNPEVVHAYRKLMQEEASSADKRIRTTAHEYPDYTNLDLEWLKPDGSVHVIGGRRFTPEGIEGQYLSSLDLQTSSGLLPVLYPAEAKFMKQFGGDIWSQLDGEKTKPGWLRAHSEGSPVNIKDPMGTSENIHKASYPGIEDFVLRSVK